LQPAQIELLEQRNHAARVVEIPAHVSVGHDVHALADDLANRADEIDVFLHPGCAVHGSPAKTHLHGLVARILIYAGLGGQLVEGLAIEAAGVNGNLLLRPATEQTEHRLFRRLAENVPQRDIHSADRRHSYALPAEGDGLAIHQLPEELDVE